MCGIAGARHDWLVARGLAPATALAAAVDQLAWRGPDGRGVVRAGPWWLGAARLAITQPHSVQPLVRRGGRFAVAFNGAVTNARELWARLLPGAERRPAPPNDAWLPLLAVAARDHAALAGMRGHHAFAVADAETGQLVFAQDRFGEKPLCCVVERIGGAPQLVAFASTAAALRTFGIVAPVSSRRLGDWFRLGFAPARPLRLAARQRIEPVPRRGVALVAVPDGACFCRDFAPPAMPPAVRLAVPPAVPPAPRPATAEAPDALRAQLVCSVGRCADTTVQVALSLSGGLDSSCLALALRDAGIAAPAYQLRARGTANDERAAAAAVARRAGLELRPVDAGPDVLDALPHLTACAGVPLGDPSVLAVHALARAAAADGVRVLLGGEGADECFSGYRRYRLLAHLPRLLWLRRPTARLAQWSMHPLARALRASVAADPVLALLAVTPPAFGKAVLAEPLARRLCWSDRSSREAAAVTARGAALADAARRRDLAGYLPFDLLPKVDVAAMAAGVEARCPYLEGDFADDAPQRPGDKSALRRAFAADLPPEVLQLDKRGFALPLDAWFRGPLPWLDLLAERRTRERPHLRPSGIVEAVDRHRSGRADLGHALYLLVACELFLRAREQGISTATPPIPPPVA